MKLNCSITASAVKASSHRIDLHVRLIALSNTFTDSIKFIKGQVLKLRFRDRNAIIDNLTGRNRRTKTPGLTKMGAIGVIALPSKNERKNKTIKGKREIPGFQER